jgi:hypothetical protein
MASLLLIPLFIYISKKKKKDPPPMLYVSFFILISLIFGHIAELIKTLE